MKLFALLRLAAWGCILVLCSVVVMSNYIVSQTALNKHALQSAALNGGVYPAIRSELLAPRILAAARESSYSTLITTDTVNKTVDQVFDDAALEKMFAPALDSMSEWLDSKQPDVSFSLDASAQMKHLSEALADAIVSHASSLPDCTYRNSFRDIENGICRSTLLSDDALRQIVLAALRTNSIIKDGQITHEQVALSDSFVARTRNIPEYINMLYSAAIFAAGIFILAGLRMIYRYRLIGIGTIGIAGLVTSTVLLIGSQYITSLLGNVALEPVYETVAKSAATLLINETRQVALHLSLASFALTLVDMASWLAVKKHRKKSIQSIHLDNITPVDTDSKE